MNLEHVMLREISQPQKRQTLCDSTDYEVPRLDKIIETESDVVDVRGCVGSYGELLFSSDRASVLQDGRSFGDGLYNSVRVLTVTEVYA